MIITKEEATKRLQSSNNLATSLAIAGAIIARNGEPVRQVAAILGTTESEIRKANKSPAVGVGVEKIRELALDRLMCSLGLLDNEKLGDLSGKELSNTCFKLAAVVDRISPKNNTLDVNANLHLHIYAPEQKRLEDYQVIDV